MRIRVIRDYSGKEGVGPDKDVLTGTEHTVTRARGNELKANGLVEIIDDEAHPDDEAEEEAQSEGGAKQLQPIANKRAPGARNKRVQAQEGGE